MLKRTRALTSYTTNTSYDVRDVSLDRNTYFGNVSRKRLWKGYSANSNTSFWLTFHARRLASSSMDMTSHIQISSQEFTPKLQRTLHQDDTVVDRERLT